MIKIVTETGTDLPHNLIDEYDIRFASGKVIFGDEIITSYPDMKPDIFYERLKRESVSPTTRDPDDRTFRDTFKKIIDEDKDAKILCVLVSEALATTIQAARRAAVFFPTTDIRIFDTRMVSLAEGLMVYQAAKMAKDGKDLESIIEALTVMRGETELYFTVDTLEYLHRGGRVGGLTRLIGEILNVKPIMRMKGGVALPFDRQRSRAKAIQAMKDKLIETGLKGEDLLLGVAHARAQLEAQKLAKELKDELDPHEIIIGEIGPTVGTHAGPGTLGLAWIRLGKSDGTQAKQSPPKEAASTGSA